MTIEVSAESSTRTFYSAVVDEHGMLSADAATERVPYWSFTKTLVATCALALVAERRLDLDALLSGKPYSLRQLLQHRSGLTDYGGLAEYHEAVARDDEPWTDDELMERSGAQQLLFAPGDSFAYSNIGYLIARRHIEHAVGMTLGDALARFVFNPFELTDCKLATHRDDMRATVFGKRRSYHPGWVYHGVVVGPVSQAALALHRIFAWNVIPARLREELLAGILVGMNLPDRAWIRAEYGLGVMTGEWSHAIDVGGHSAGGPGSSGAVYSRRSGRLSTVAVFTNSDDASIAEWEAQRRLTNGN